MTEGLILVGYWHSEYEQNYPDPNKLQSKNFWEDFERINYCNKKRITLYLDSGIPCNFYRGISRCRICEKFLGSFERHDYKYIWPDQLSHYISEHDVILPKDFIQHILNNMSQQLPINTNYWLKWGEKEEKV